MQQRVVLVSAAVAVLGVTAAILGFAAEGTKPKSLVGYDVDEQRCVYRRTPALACGVLAALLALTGLALATAASGCFGRCGSGGSYDTPAAVHRRATASKLAGVAWVLVVVAAVLFLYGAAMNQAGTRAPSSSRIVRYYYGYYYAYNCIALKNGVFATASIISAGATACAIAAYVSLQQQTAEPAPAGQFAAQPYPPAYPPPAYPPPAYPPAYPPPAYPPPPPPPYGDYGAKQPAGQA